MEQNTKNAKVLRLTRTKFKGIWRILFSRLPILVLLILMQAAVYAAIFLRLRDYLPHYTIVVTVFTVIMTLYLFNNGMDSTAKLTWLALITLLPVLGAFLLLYTQLDLGHRAIQRRVESLIAETKHALPQPPGVLEALGEDGSATDDLNRYLNRSGCFPAYRDTEAVYLSSGEAMLAALLPELEKAESFIYLEFFILHEGYMWGRVLETLARKAKAGVDVRVIYDGFCALGNLPYNYPKLLAELGIRAKVFAPVMPLLSTYYNYRDHRKIIVIDGNVAFTGGVNLADEYINVLPRFGRWKDAAVLLRGGAAASFTLMFLQMWNVGEREPDFSALSIPTTPAEHAEGYVIPFADCPLDEDKVGETVYMDILYRAETYVHIMTPYLILDGELAAALKYAAQRGVDVKLILPGIPDKRPAYALAKSHYRELVRAGVRIFEYTPGFVHSKVFVSDGRKAVVGTINLDYRSLYHHFECAAYLYRTPCVADAEADFQEALLECRAVTEETIRRENPLYKLGGGVMKLIAPLI